MAGGRPRKPLNQDRTVDGVVRLAIEQLATGSRSGGKTGAVTALASSSTHLHLAVFAARVAAAADRLARHHVALAREVEGATWEQVGEAFGTTRQSAHERFGSSSGALSRRRRTPASHSQ